MEEENKNSNNKKTNMSLSGTLSFLGKGKLKFIAPFILPAAIFLVIIAIIAVIIITFISSVIFDDWVSDKELEEAAQNQCYPATITGKRTGNKLTLQVTSDNGINAKDIEGTIKEGKNDIYTFSAKNTKKNSQQATISGTTNEEKIWIYFVQHGYSKAATAGIMGNFKQESASTFNPKIIQGGAIAPDNYKMKAGVGFGLVQWTSAGRQKNLQKFADKQGRAITNLYAQLDFSVYEQSKYSGLNGYKTISDPKEAAKVFHDKYEISDDYNRYGNINNRTSAAEEYYNQYKDMEVFVEANLQGTIQKNYITIKGTVGDQEISGAGTIKNNKIEVMGLIGAMESCAGYYGNLGTGIFSYPLSKSGPITGKFGEDRGDHIHAGIDVGIPVGTPIVAAESGTVEFSGISGGLSYGYGRLIIIDHGKNVKTYYGHQSKLLVQKGQTVIRGQQIGESGNTGSSTGPHLHFEIRVNGKAVNPLKYITVPK